MRRFIVVGLIVAFTHSFANDNTYNKSKSAFDGFYVSAGIGDASGILQFENSSSFISDQTPSPLNIDSLQAQTIQQKSVLGYFNLGYGRLFTEQLYLSFFAYLDVASHKFNNKLTAENDDLNPAGGNDGIFINTTTTKLGNVSGGIAFKPGWLLTPETLFFGVIGWQSAKESVSADQSVTIGKLPAAVTATGTSSASTDKTINGLRLGLGFEQQVKKAMMIGLRYVYTFYYNAPSLTTPVTTATGILAGPFSYTLGEQKINTQAVIANLSYYLGEPSDFNDQSNIVPDDFNGRFFGLKLGAVNPSISGNSSITANYVDDAADLESIQISNTKPNDKALALFGFTIGYGQVFKNRYYLGLEGFVEASNNTIGAQLEHGFRPTAVAVGGQAPDTVTHTKNIKLWNPQPGGDIKIGIILYNRILNFFKVGLVLNKVRATTSDQLSYEDASGPPGIRTNLNLNLNSNNSVKANLRLGAGFDFQFSPHNAFSLEYDYTDYGTVGISGSTSAIDAAGNNATLTQHSALKLATNYLTIGYVHFFE